MTGVEVPDYSWIPAFMSIVLAVTSLVCLLRGKFSKFINKLRKKNRSYLEETETRLKLMHKPRISKRLSMWNQRPHLKEDTHLCGFVKPGEWQCRCGKRKCETFGNLCEAVGGVDATPPVEPMPDRKAAIAHTKAKS